jgi:fucose 4-O-acetylase-like acetyltransferase
VSDKLSLGDLAARTPDTRDRYVDFVRAFSILTVVAGHWAICIVWWQQGYIRSTSVIGEARGVWLATWVFQVMPLFFFVGGFSNLVTYDSFKKRGLTTGKFLRIRSWRLLKPSLVFLGIWAVIQIALHLLDVGAGTGFKVWGDTWFLRGMMPPGATIPFGALWFLPAYLVIILFAPPMLWLHRRFGIWVVVVLTALTALVDLVGFGIHSHGLRYWNVLFVWLIPHQIGFFYGDGRMQKLRKRTLVIMALCGLAVMIVLTNPPVFFGHGTEFFSGLRSYPKSLLGTDNEPVANTYPPTFVMVGMIYWSIGVCMLLREAGQRWLRHSKRAWMGTIYVNSVIMTLYLWHMTAFLLAILVLWPLGLGTQTIGIAGFRYHPDLSWWVQRPLFIIVPGLFLAGIVSLLGRFERPKLGRNRAGPTEATRSA